MTQTRIYFILCCNPVYLNTVHKALLPWAQQGPNLRGWFLCSLIQWLLKTPQSMSCPVPQRLPHLSAALALFPTLPCQFSFPVPYRQLPPQRFAQHWLPGQPLPTTPTGIWSLFGCSRCFSNLLRQKTLHSHVKLELCLITPTMSNEASPRLSILKVLSVLYCLPLFSWWLLTAFTGALMKFSIFQYFWQRGQCYHGWVRPSTLDAVSAPLESIWHF